jgi:hypothetical protein
MSEPRLPAELAELFSALCDDSATPVQWQRLEELALADDTVCRLYLNYMALHGSLGADDRAEGRIGEWATASIAPSASQASAAKSLVPPSPTRPLAHSSKLGFLVRVSRGVPGGEATVGGLVVLVLVAAFLGLAQKIMYPNLGDQDLAREDLLPSPPEGEGPGVRRQAPRVDSDSGNSVATILGSEAVQWSSSEMSNLKSQIGKGERLQIDSGLVELELKQGVKLLIEGPAEWSIDGHNNATLKRGKLVAKVPTQAIGFTLQTPTAKIVDLGTEFGVEVGEYGSAEVHVLRGRVRATGLAAAGQNRAVAKSVVLEAGSTIRSDRGQLSEVETAVDDETFKSLAARMAKSDRQQVFMGSIPLGNLFDDRMPMTLAAAIETDTFQACPDSDHLGVQSVLIGGDAIKSLTREIRLDLTNLGWTGQSYSLPCNDAAVPNRELQERWAIHTKGFKPRPAPGKAEDGIGMHTDCVLTFDLDEIRAAGGLAGRPLRFVCDRAGINDERIGLGETRCRLLVVVCNAHAVTSAYVNGAQIDAQRENEVWQIAKQTDDSLIKAGSFSTFNISLPGEARYLTLAATSGEGGTCTHTVWSGARLEVQ